MHLTKDEIGRNPEPDRPATVMVTAEMREAGRNVLRARFFGQDLEEVVEDVFWAMMSAASWSDELLRLMDQGCGLVLQEPHSIGDVILDKPYRGVLDV